MNYRKQLFGQYRRFELAEYYLFKTKENIFWFRYYKRCFGRYQKRRFYRITTPHYQIEQK